MEKKWLDDRTAAESDSVLCFAAAVARTLISSTPARARADRGDDGRETGSVSVPDAGVAQCRGYALRYLDSVGCAGSPPVRGRGGRARGSCGDRPRTDPRRSPCVCLVREFGI
jgi:hypothetical protein